MNDRNKISNFKNENELNMEKIINEYSNYLFTVIKNISGEYMKQEDIEEIILDVFLALWKNKDKLEYDKNIKPYIASIAHHLTKKKLSTLNEKLKLTELDENILFNNWNELFERQVEMKELEKILECLSDEDYQIFTLFYYESNKTKEIAKKLGVSDTKIRIRLYRIRKILKKKLKERGYSI